MFTDVYKEVHRQAPQPWEVTMPEPDSGRTTSLLELLASQKDPDLTQAIPAAISDDGFRRQLLDALTSRNDNFRFNCFKVLEQASARDPASLCRHWDELVLLLDSPNAYHRSTAVRLLANLARADAPGRFESLADRFFDLLDDDKIVTARYLVGTVSTIIESHPHLIPKVSARLLAVDETHHTEGRKDLLKGDIVEAFGRFFAQVPDKSKVVSFVRAQLKSSSPRTRKAAKAFLDLHSG